MSKSKRNRHPVFIEIPKPDEFKLPIMFVSHGKRIESPVEVIANIPVGVDLVEARLQNAGPNRSIRFFMKGGASLFITIDKQIQFEDAVQSMMAFEGSSRYKVFLI